MTADLQARRRIGLTATLVREDGREGDVFSLIGPKRYDAPWKDIEAQGWIAPGRLRRGAGHAARGRAAGLRDGRARGALPARVLHRTRKTRVVERARRQAHAGEPTLVIGQYLDQLDELGERLDAPVIKGETPVKERERLFEAFRHGEIDLLVVSKVANFSVDLPSAAVAIQVSGLVRLPPGGGPAARPAAAAQGRGQALGALLRDRLPRHRRRRLRPEPAAVPRRAGLRLPHRRRRRHRHRLTHPAEPGRCGGSGSGLQQGWEDGARRS